MSIDMNNVYVDGKKTTFVTVGKRSYDIESLIKKQLRTIKRDKPDMDKRRIISKEEQKVALGGMSPDFSDDILMRAYFDFQKKTSSDWYKKLVR